MSAPFYDNFAKPIENKSDLLLKFVQKLQNKYGHIIPIVELQKLYDDFLEEQKLIHYENNEIKRHLINE